MPLPINMSRNRVLRWPVQITNPFLLEFERASRFDSLPVGAPCEPSPTPDGPSGRVPSDNCLDFSPHTFITPTMIVPAAPIIAATIIGFISSHPSKRVYHGTKDILRSSVGFACGQIIYSKWGIQCLPFQSVRVHS